MLSSNLWYSTVRTVHYQLLAGHVGGLNRTRIPYVKLYCACVSFCRVDVNVARVLLSAGGAQRHIFIFGQKRGKPGGAAYWFGVEAKKGERIIPRSCPARFRLMFCSIVSCVVLDRLKLKNVLAFI
jgi:hypothetical protein